MIYLHYRVKRRPLPKRQFAALLFVGSILIIFLLMGLNELSEQFTLYMQIANLCRSFKLLYSLKKIKAIILLKMKRHKPFHFYRLSLKIKVI